MIICIIPSIKGWTLFYLLKISAPNSHQWQQDPKGTLAQNPKTPKNKNKTKLTPDALQAPNSKTEIIFSIKSFHFVNQNSRNGIPFT